MLTFCLIYFQFKYCSKVNNVAICNYMHTYTSTTSSFLTDLNKVNFAA